MGGTCTRDSIYNTLSCIGDVMTFRAQGMRAWLLQRLSAFYLAIVVLVSVVWWFATDSVSYEEWRQLIGHPFVAVILALFFLALLFHAWVGIRDVMVDYIPHIGVRLVFLLSIAGVLLSMAVWTTFILLSVVYI